MATATAASEFGDDEIGQLLADRAKTHGEAHLIIGQYLSVMYKQGLLDKVFATPQCFDWLMVFAKLVRMTQDPTFGDNPRDVEGYARLIRLSMSKTE